MSTGFFTSRGFSPFGASLFGNGTPSVDNANFFGLPASSTNYDSDLAKQNVWSGVLSAYKNVNAPSSFQKWLGFQQPIENAGYQLWRQQPGNSAGSFADYEALRNLQGDWANLDPYTAGRSNYFIRSRFSGG